MSLFAELRRRNVFRAGAAGVALVLIIGIMAAERLGTIPAEDTPPAAQTVPQELRETVDLAPSATAGSDRSIALLPFKNRSVASENSQFFSDGMHDDLLTLLSRIHQLKVISRTSVMKYANSDESMRQIGRELGVSTLLEGEVQQAGHRIRVNVQLINATNDAHLWAGTFDRELTTENIFGIQAAIARVIAAALEANLTPEEEVSLTPAPTENLDAYLAVLKSRRLQEHAHAEALEAAAREARKAIVLDPSYANAYLALANALIAAITSGTATDEAVGGDFIAAVGRAMEIEPDNPGSHTLLASYRFLTGKPEWESGFVRALQLDPGNPETQYTYGSALDLNGRPDRGLPLLLEARTRNPLSTRIHLSLGRIYLALGQFDEARKSFERLRDIDPASILGYGPVSASYMEQARLGQALSWAHKALAIDPDDYETGAWMLVMFQAMEDHHSATRWSEWLERRVTKQAYPIAIQAMHQYLNGNFELALQMSNLALNMQLPNRWGSDAIFMRIKRDEALSNGNPDETIELFRKRHPALFRSPPAVDAENLQQAADLSLLLKLAGRTAEFDRLTGAVIEYYDRPFATNGATRFWLKPVKAEALALRGEQDAALKELQRIIDAGWRVFWHWKTEMNFNFHGIRDAPEFQAMVNAISADMAMQRADAQAMEEWGEISEPPQRMPQTIEGLLKEL
jgi:TolB-like protein